MAKEKRSKEQEGHRKKIAKNILTKKGQKGKDKNKTIN